MRMVTKEQITEAVKATIDRLNASGRDIANVFSAIHAVQELEEKKVKEAFTGLFVNYTLDELALAAQTLIPMCKSLQEKLHDEHAALMQASQDVTPAPATESNEVLHDDIPRTGPVVSRAGRTARNKKVKKS